MLPSIIQGGMGVGVSGWRLARAVSLHGQLGVVSGTALDALLTRQLQDGDPGGHLRRAMAAFPDAEVIDAILSRYFIDGGKAPDQPYRTPAMVSHQPSRTTVDLLTVAAFVSIHLAKEGHDGVVGLNLLEKIQTPTLHVLHGAMLAGVDVVLMGAGIPRQIPGILDGIAAGMRVEMRLDVTGGTRPLMMELDASRYASAARLRRPMFLAVVSSPVLAMTLQRKSNGRVDGFVVEAPVAGGHNAPPRGPMQLGETGEPVYGERDHIDPSKFTALGLPFWLAGGYGRSGMLREALALGAHGIQVGTAFAFCEESGFDPQLKAQVIAALQNGQLKVRTAPDASPTGFPFKVANVAGSLADEAVYAGRERVCDLGILRECYEKPDGTIGFRCSAEPVAPHVAKGGKEALTVGRLCLCNSLCAAAGVPQLRNGAAEPPLVTMGDDLDAVREHLVEGKGGYSAAEVVDRLLA